MNKTNEFTALTENLITLSFRGNIKSKNELPLNTDIGDVYMCDEDNSIWVCTTSSTYEICASPSPCLTGGWVEKNHITYPTNCKNCGAILHNHICEYCGSDNSI